MTDDPTFHNAEQLRALLDQFNAYMRDTILDAIVNTEQLILRKGGSDELAVDITLEYAQRLFDIVKFGRFEE